MGLAGIALIGLGKGLSSSGAPPIVGVVFFLLRTFT